MNCTSVGLLIVTKAPKIMDYNFPDSLCYILTYYSQHIRVNLEDPIELLFTVSFIEQDNKTLLATFSHSSGTTHLLIIRHHSTFVLQIPIPKFTPTLRCIKAYVGQSIYVKWKIRRKYVDIKLKLLVV